MTAGDAGSADWYIFNVVAVTIGGAGVVLLFLVMVAIFTAVRHAQGKDSETEIEAEGPTNGRANGKNVAHQLKRQS